MSQKSLCLTLAPFVSASLLAFGNRYCNHASLTMPQGLFWSDVYTRNLLVTNEIGDFSPVTAATKIRDGCRIGEQPSDVHEGVL